MNFVSAGVFRSRERDENYSYSFLAHPKKKNRLKTGGFPDMAEMERIDSAAGRSQRGQTRLNLVNLG